MGRAGATLQVLIIVKHFISRKIVANIKWRRICLATNVPKSLNLSPAVQQNIHCHLDMRLIFRGNGMKYFI